MKIVSLKGVSHAFSTQNVQPVHLQRLKWSSSCALSLVSRRSDLSLAVTCLQAIRTFAMFFLLRLRPKLRLSEIEVFVLVLPSRL